MPTSEQGLFGPDLCRLLLLALLVFSGSIGQSFAAEVSVSSNQLPIALSPYLDYLEDTGRELTIEDLLTNPTRFQWRRNTQNTPTLGISNSAHWFFLQILPRDLKADVPLILTVDAPIIDRIDIYFVIDRQLTDQTTVGDTIPFSALRLPLRIPAVELEQLETGRPVGVYFRITSSSGVEFPLLLTDLELLLFTEQGAHAYLGAFFTFITLCTGVCLLIYVYLRDPVFFHVSVFFLAGIVFFLGLTGAGRLWLWPESEELNTRLVFIAGSFLILSLTSIGRSLDLKSRYQDSVRLVMRIISVGMVAAAFYFLFIPFEKIARETVLPLMAMGFIVALAVITMAGIAAVRGSRTAIFLFLSWALMLLSYILTLFYKFQLIERSALISTFGQGFFLVSAALLLVSLGEFIRYKNSEFQDARSDVRAKTDFLRNVSREILTPVHLVLANSKRLLSGHTDFMDDKTRNHVTTIIKQSNYLHNLINDLLEMAELESDSFEPTFELVEMSRFLNEIRDLTRKAVEEKHLTLETSYSSANLLLQTDRARLQHALTNLIHNAVSFTDKGSVTLSYKAIYFHRRLGIEISVKDTGRGMSEEFKRQLFNEFSRETPASELDPKGTGLSLVIVKRMVEKLGGEIDFESRLNKGSEFFIRLPLRHSSD
ncbi:MAG: sensor histidine kinase [Pseudohongiellaceae bacterium]